MGTPELFKKTTLVCVDLYKNLEEELFVIVAETIPPEPLEEKLIPEMVGNSLDLMSLILGDKMGDKKVLLTDFELCTVEANHPVALGKRVGVNSVLLSTETP